MEKAGAAGWISESITSIFEVSTLAACHFKKQSDRQDIFMHLSGFDSFAVAITRVRLL
jgi:hypothetical protein